MKQANKYSTWSRLVSVPKLTLLFYVLAYLIVVVAVASSLAAKVSQNVDLRCDGLLLVADRKVGQGWEQIFPASETGPPQEEAYLSNKK